MRFRTFILLGLSCLLSSIVGLGCPKKDAPSSEGGDKGDKGGGKSEDEKDGGALKAVSIAAGQSIACAVMRDGTVRCWGRGDFGEFGSGKSEPRDAATPIEIRGVKGAKSIVIGGDPGSAGDAICVALEGGKYKCWGHGRVIPGLDGGYAKPAIADELEGAKQVVWANGTGYAVMPDGTVKAWTDNNCFNTTGTGKLTDQKGVVKVPGVKDVVMVGASQTSACALLKDGTVTCWGYSGKKQPPTVVDGATDGTAIVGNASSDDTCIVNKDKKVACWGESQKVSERSTLKKVASLAVRGQSCALLVGGKVSCFGSYNDYGQGAEKVRFDKKITQLAAGLQFNCALDEDGAVFCWGYNHNGQLGDGTLMDSPDPVKVKGLGKMTLPKEADGADKATESKVKQSFDDLPKGCKHDDTLKAKFKYLDGDELGVKSAYALNQYDGTTIAVVLANYQVDPKNQGEYARGKQIKLNLRFGKIDLEGDKKPMKVDEGTFSMDTKQERLVYVSASYRSGDTSIADWSLEGIEAGTVEIKHLNAEWVCGHVAVKTKDDSFEGDFAAAIVGK